MSRIFVRGLGAVSPAGWGVPALRELLAKNQPLPSVEQTRPDWPRPIRVRSVPAPPVRPGFLSHNRLRRTSPIAQYAVAAALEALGADARLVASGALRLGILYCVMSGCVNYSRRFYREAWQDPTTASPLVFPETVFNAPASHLAALLGTTGINYTLVGDAGTFVQAMALAADWLGTRRVDGCLIVGAEELDWLVREAFCLFDRDGILSEGAGALYLGSQPAGPPALELKAITESYLFATSAARAEAALRARVELHEAPDGARAGLPEPEVLLCDGLQGLRRMDADECAAWQHWSGPRISPKRLLGEAFVAAAAWQCVAALDELARNGYQATNVSVVGCNQQAIAARFTKSNLDSVAAGPT